MKLHSPRQTKKQSAVAEFPSRRALNDARNQLHDAVVQSASANSTAALVIHTLLYRFYNVPTGACFPGLEKIATKIKRSVPTVRRAIKSLEAAGFISVVRAQGRGNTNNIYFNWTSVSRQIPQSKPDRVETFSKQENPSEMAPKPVKNGGPYSNKESNQPFNQMAQSSIKLFGFNTCFSGVEKWNDWLSRHDYPNLDTLAEKVTTESGCFFLLPNRYPPSSFGTFEEQRVRNWASQRLAEIKKKNQMRTDKCLEAAKGPVPGDPKVRGTAQQTSRN